MVSRKDLANAVRVLSMDAVQKANSGHPGMPMGMADIAEVLWNTFLRHNPKNPSWPNRDRFILSNGHGSMLHYALLHLAGYDLTIEDLKNFRQLHSKTPGHPEYGYTPGIETTTGPLGQGIANGVGMAIAEKTLAGQFNRPGHAIIDHFTYVFLGDGCMMEGISHEACSLAGTLKLGKLIALYDDNGISIDGEVQGWFTDDTVGRFTAYGWQVIDAVDGHDPEAIAAALTMARENLDQPTLICCKTTIGYGSPNKGGKENCHGAPLGEEEIALVRQELHWPHAPFVIPEEIYTGWNAVSKGAAMERQWQEEMEAYAADYPELAKELGRRLAGELPENFIADADAFIAEVAAKGENIASRKASQKALEGFGPLLPELIGGSADLAGSNLTLWHGSRGIQTDPAGNYIYFGVREFGMAAIENGLALHGGFIPYGATFLIFSEYARNALRMAALMQIQSLFIFTHDSIGLGEDGPTHQAVEQTATLRLIPNMHVWRPCDAVESAVAWKSALLRQNGPSSLLFSRQTLPHQARSRQQIQLIEKGGYILREAVGRLDVIFIATGSEVALALAAAEALETQGTGVRVVSMPCCELFDQQDREYREHILPTANRKRVAIEAGVTDYWRKYVGLEGAVIGIDRFGESAPANTLFDYFGFTVENIVAKTNAIL